MVGGITPFDRNKESFVRARVVGEIMSYQKLSQVSCDGDSALSTGTKTSAFFLSSCCAWRSRRRRRVRVIRLSGHPASLPGVGIDDVPSCEVNFSSFVSFSMVAEAIEELISVLIPSIAK